MSVVSLPFSFEKHDERKKNVRNRLPIEMVSYSKYVPLSNYCRNSSSILSVLCPICCCFLFCFPSHCVSFTVRVECFFVSLSLDTISPLFFSLFFLTLPFLYCVLSILVQLFWGEWCLSTIWCSWVLDTLCKERVIRITCPNLYYSFLCLLLPLSPLCLMSILWPLFLPPACLTFKPDCVWSSSL